MSLEGLTVQTISSSARVVSRAVWEICRAWASTSSGEILVALDHFAQQRDLGEAGAELVVDVAGDAGALLFQRLLLPQSCQLALQLLGGNIMDDADDAAEQENGGAAEEPPGPPEGRQNHHRETGAGFVPDAVFVAGGHLEPVAPGGSLL